MYPREQSWVPSLPMYTKVVIKKQQQKRYFLVHLTQKLPQTSQLGHCFKFVCVSEACPLLFSSTAKCVNGLAPKEISETFYVQPWKKNK